MEAKLKEVISQNDFTRAYRFDDVEMYASKAYDEDSDTHYLVVSIPSIPAMNLLQVQYPMKFDTEEQRNDMFALFTLDYAEQFIYNLIIKIKEQKNGQA
jgi:hypothetical protein